MVKHKLSREKTGEMDDGGGAGFNSITSSNCRGILALFLIISLPLLLYQNSAYNSLGSFRKLEQNLQKEEAPMKTASESSSSSQTAQDHGVAPAPAPTKIEIQIQRNSRDVLSPSQTITSLNQTLKNTTNTTSLNQTLKNTTNTTSLNQTLKNTTNTTSLNQTLKNTTNTTPTSTSNSTTSNKLLNGLLPLGFDTQSCLSRYSSHLYRKPSPHKPSPHLISKLRSYERLHRRCGPKSSHYTKTLTKLTKTKHISNSLGCNYIVWLPVNGLGNRMISLAATFLYALLTNRVLLVAFEHEMSGVFCEPFLNSTWKLPRDFPHRHQFDGLPTYASLVKHVNASSMDVLPFVFVNLQHQREERERFFHCGEGQRILERVPFLILRSDQYFAPSLFMVPSFKRSLNLMFREKDMVFHHLGRYLFSPSNVAWKQITRFYKAKLAKADKKVGIQVRVFAPKLTPTKTITQQILACTLNNNILPNVDETKDTASKNETSMSKAVLVTSLYEEYSENLRAFYKAEKAVRVYQPSHEEVQKFHDNAHHVKALIEMYLLSLCDELVTSGQSTFGYVAQGLGGLKPWIMYKTVGTEFRDPPCAKGLSMEPCFHFPPRYDCEKRTQVEHISYVFPHMRQCEDIGSGVKMVMEA